MSNKTMKVLSLFDGISIAQQVLKNQNIPLFKEVKDPKKAKKLTENQQIQKIKIENERKEKQDNFAYNVAWANIKDWILAQMALYETQIVTMPQIFLPFLMLGKGQTLYNQLENKQFLLN
jgi:hypothetical protein